jgi:hypothetical protein
MVTLATTWYVNTPSQMRRLTRAGARLSSSFQLTIALSVRHGLCTALATQRSILEDHRVKHNLHNESMKQRAAQALRPPPPVNLTKMKPHEIKAVKHHRALDDRIDQLLGVAGVTEPPPPAVPERPRARMSQLPATAAAMSAFSAGAGAGGGARAAPRASPAPGQQSSSSSQWGSTARVMANPLHGDGNGYSNPLVGAAGGGGGGSGAGAGGGDMYQRRAGVGPGGTGATMGLARAAAALGRAGAAGGGNANGQRQGQQPAGGVRDPRTGLPPLEAPGGSGVPQWGPTGNRHDEI